MGLGRASSWTRESPDIGTDAVNVRLPPIPVAVIVPVYEGLSETKACIESVLNFLPNWVSLIIVNDASPNQAIVSYCHSLKNKFLKICG